MSVVVLSCGRTGTNIALEMLRGNSNLKASQIVENKGLTKPVKLYPNNYLTKCDTVYVETDEMVNLLETNPNMKIIWTIRDPRDVMMCKIRRGQPNTEGRGNWVSDDGTPEGAEDDMRVMLSMYSHLIEVVPEKIMLVRMEDMITNTEKTAKKMCEFLGIDFEEEMTNFPNRMRIVERC
jgi:hypothetical protein